MHFAKFFVVFSALTGTMFSSSAKISVNKPDGFADLEEASIKLLTTCYKSVDGTIVLVGTFSGNFVRRLSSHRFFNVALLDHTTRTMNNIFYSQGHYKSTARKVHIAVVSATRMKQFTSLVQTFKRSAYYNTVARVILLSSSKNGNSIADSLDMMFTANIYGVPNLIVLYGDNTMKPLVFGSNPYRMQAPAPWKFIASIKISNWPLPLSAFRRQYLESDEMCENLYFEKTRDLGGLPIKTMRMCRPSHCSKVKDAIEKQSLSARMRILNSKSASFIEHFFAYVNATEETVWVEIEAGKEHVGKPIYFQARTQMLRVKLRRDYAYPHGVVCMFLVTQHRGNKTQCEKTISVIDGYSWIGLFVVSLTSLAFFRCFLRGSLIDGLLNVVRLTCNCGISTTPRNAAPRIYLGCLLFVVVTMQGIFMGNLAAMLTQDSPVRQVNSISDLADLEYRVFAEKTFLILFKDVVPKDRIFALFKDESCFKRIRRDPTIACLAHNPDLIDYYRRFNLHVSDCISTEYVTNGIPRDWPFEERLNEFLGNIVAGGIRMDLATIVEEKRLLEKTALEDEQGEPRIMAFEDFRFAFVILGIGLVLASVIFVTEIIVHRYRGGVRKTRVVALN